MKKISQTNAAYIAGFFDGEGCICTVGSSKCHLSISIGQKFPNILYHIYKIIKLGRVRKHNHYTRPHTTYNLTITNRKQVKNFINLILPYSLIKKKQLEIGIKLITLVKNSGIHLTKEEQIQRQLLCNELKGLKKQDYE